MPVKNPRLDYITPLPDISDRIEQWKESTVSKSVKAAEQGLVKALRKQNASLNAPEALQQLESVTGDAREKATSFFDSLPVPLNRLGSVAETASSKTKLMLEAMAKMGPGGSSKSEKESLKVKVGYPAAVCIKERDGTLRSKKKTGSKKDKNSSTQCLVTLGKHMLR